MASSLTDADRDVILGDLGEEFAARAAEHGVPRARRWYWRQTRRSIAPNVRRRFAESARARRVARQHARLHARHHDSRPQSIRLTVEDLMTDLRDALRALRAAPSFTVVALVVLTLGIGATTAIFSVVDAVVLRGLPFDEHDRLVAVGERRPPGKSRVTIETGDPHALMSIAAPNYLDWAAQQQVFESMSVFMPGPFSSVTLKEPGAEPEELAGMRVTASFFDVLRVGPARGRAFTAEHEIDGRHRVAVISDALWQRRFGGDPTLVGRTIQLDDGPYAVMGIMPPGVTYPVGAVRPTEVWVPYVIPPRERIRDPRGRAMILHAIARLKPGVSIGQAQAQMDQIAASLEQANPEWNKDNQVGVRPLRDHLVGAQMKSWMMMLLGAVALVLLIACANVANLLLARATDRAREVAVRAALGAGRWRLVSQLMTESLVLSIIGTVLATVVAWWVVQVLRSAMPDGMPRVSTIAVNLRVLAAAAGLSFITALLFGIFPALQLSKPDLNGSLKEGTRGAGVGRGPRRLRSALVVAEVALAVVLLVGAALFIGSFITVMRIDLGFSTDRVLCAQIMPRSVPNQPGMLVGNMAPPLLEIVERVRQAPGVVQAAMIAGGLPMSGFNMGNNVSVPGRELSGEEARINVRLVTPDYHKALRIQLKRGRLLEPTDREGVQKVVLLNESAANAYFPGEDPIGRTITLSRDNLTIVGIVGDVHQGGPESDMAREAYQPLAQSMMGKGFGELVVHTSGDPYAALPAIKAAVRAVLPDVPLRNVRTMEEQMARRTAERRVSMLLLGLFGLLGLVISAVGVYGVMAYAVAQRTHEIGVRIALGATQLRVIGMVLAHAITLVASGLIVGALGAWYLSAAAKTFLFRIEATDPRAFLAALVTLGIAALIASAIPARRAASVDPQVALRAE